ncbi:Na+:solute symporter [Myxococcota bacterium]|nr:Na+:solute symporter [Myxococcota bacterium]
MIIGLYLGGAFVWGAWHARRASSSRAAFFVAGRSLPWWLAGTSIVATTFAADTPLAVAGLVASEGIAGNWFWWADVLPAVIGALIVGQLWRRSGVLTDNEITEIRYGGRTAAGLRLFRAAYFGVLRNAIVMGWVNLAMLKVLSLALGVDESESGWILAGLFVLTVGYTLLAGLVGVVFTDFLQFGLALVGSVALAVLAVKEVGGMSALLTELGDRAELLALLPSAHDSEAVWAFAIYVGLKSWSSGNTEGHGYTAQRILATRDERHARLAGLWYAIAHFALRPWPWVIVGLVAVIQYPGLEDPEAGYVRVMLETLPDGLRGLMLAAMLAAFMSTIDTQLNWGASYLTHDVYARFVKPDASERSLVRVARVCIVGLAAFGVAATFAMDSVSGAWKLLATISAGSGLILLLRWLWWRINAWSEISVMLASLLGTHWFEGVMGIPFPLSFVWVVAFAISVSLLVTWLTPPEDPATLRHFFERVRPLGAWGPVARAAGLPLRPLGWRPWLEVAMATLGIYGVLLGTGWWLLGKPLQGTLVMGVAAWVLVVVARGVSRAPAVPQASPDG